MSMEEYRLEKQIGSGSFGEVFRGEDKKTGMKVAVKRIRKKVLYENGQYLLKAYKREIEIMTKCACENSIKFIKEFATQNNLNIIMELCDTDLLCYLYERPKAFSVEEIRDTFSQLNNAFRKMNQNNILHRDLKLGNILIKFTDESKTSFIPKLSDYGFSKELNSYNFSTTTHLGTPATMAPEIMMNRPYDDKSDLWSIGVMMYQLYYREVPYDGQSENEILQQIMSHKPFKQPEDPNFRDLLNKLLVVDVRKRLSWKEYYNHPFFGGNNFYKNKSNTLSEDKNFNINSMSFNANFMNNSMNSFNNLDNNNNKSNSFGVENDMTFERARTGNIRSDFGYSYSTDIFEAEENYTFKGGDIYGKKEPSSSKDLVSIRDFFNKAPNLESKINLLYRGTGINDFEYQNIISACIEFLDNNINPTSFACLQKLERITRGKWFVLVCNENDSNFDFYFPNKLEVNTVVFNYKNIQFQLCRLNNI